MSNNPYQNPPGMSGQDFLGGNQGGPPPGGMPPGGAPDAAGRVSAPAIALMVVGGICLMLSLFGVGSSVLMLVGGDAMKAQNQQQMEDLRQQLGDNAQIVDFMEQMNSIQQGPIGLIMNLIALVIAGLILFGAIKMKNLQSYGLALTAAILAMLPLNSCCCLGLPIGVWALVVLLNGDVKNAFR